MAESSSSGSRFSSLRRLSAIGRRDSSKRNRGSSVGTSESVDRNDGERKKQRVESSPLPPTIEIPSSPPRPNLSSSSSSTPTSDPTQPYPQPGQIDAGPSTPLSPPGSPDALLPDRLRTLSTIRDTLGPDWSSNTANPSTAQERLQNLQRRSLSAASGTEEDNETGRIADRIYSLLGLTPPTQSRSLNPSPLPSPSLEPQTQAASRSIDDDSDTALEDLTRRLENARANLADAQRQLEELDTTRTETTATEAQTGSTGPTSPNSPVGAGGGGIIPAGAVLIIQGLAQTHTVPTTDSSSSSTGAGSTAGSSVGALESMARRIQGLRPRSSSEGNALSPSGRRGLFGSLSDNQQQDNTNNGSAGVNEADPSGSDSPSLDGQARMISGLLT